MVRGLLVTHSVKNPSHWYHAIRTASLVLGAWAGMVAAEVPDGEAVAELAVLGKQIFTDPSLSSPVGQSCVSCHVPRHAFADPRPVSPGAVSGRSGIRNTPSLMYAALIPNLEQEDLLQESGEQVWVWQGGLFQDGSARTLDKQVTRPFFNHLEMNLGGEAELASKIRDSAYWPELSKGMGDEAGDDTKVARRVTRALVEFLKEPMFRPFDARIDDYLKGDEGALSEQEKRGLEVFRNAGKCADCHFLHENFWPGTLLSDYGYDNLGVPSRGPRDPGLGGHTKVPAELGMFRSPGLRNVALTAPYFHNGSVATLREVVEFYNLRDVDSGRWGPTDYPETVNREDMGNLGLSEQQVSDLVALMEAFTDRSILEMNRRGGDFPSPPPGVPGSWEMRAYFPDWHHARPPMPPHPPYGGSDFPPPVQDPTSP
ncbi:MAG: cytochrome B6 [Verrucomicrobiaceae bacterium]|nr:MAG: cytochrome B6 [Verrucomicrobiaceae bacterium]